MIRLEDLPLIHAAKGNYGGTRKAEQIRYLVYHYTANDGDTAANNASYYARSVVKASAHYFVDDDHITQSVPDLTVAWAVGGNKWTDCAKTGGGTLYGVATNTNSISIELCGTGEGRTASEKTLARATELGRALMAKYGIPIERVIRHFDVTGKHCPAYLMEATAWEAFKRRLAETEDDMKELYYESLVDVPSWARPTVEKLIGKGILQGTDAGLHLSVDMLRILVWHDRAGLYG